MGDPRHDLGLAAEATVAAWLTGIGWTVVGQRVRSAAGSEVDLIALDPGQVLVGVEIRARRTLRTGTGAESIDGRRVARMGRTLATFAARCETSHIGLRLDIVCMAPEPGIPGRWRVRRVPDIGSG
jgi:putative endonuclease